MNRSLLFLALLTPLAHVLVTQATGQPAPPAPPASTVQTVTPASRAMMIDFDKETAAKLPPGWKAEGTNQKGPVSTWQIAEADKAPSGTNILGLTSVNHDSGGTYNVCWTDTVKFADGAIEVKVRADSGNEDQGGGPIWRVKDKNNYLIARYNPLEENFRLYYVKDGSRKQLATAKIDPAVPAGQWFTIRVEQKGNAITCFLNGKKELEATDDHVTGAGGIGVWTKADAATSFDDLKIEAGTLVAGAATGTTQTPHAFVTNFGGDTVSAIDLDDAEVVATIRTGNKPHGVVVAPDGSRVYVTNEADGTLTAIEWPSGEVVRQVPVGSAPHQLDVSPDGKRLFIPLNGEDRVVVLNATTFEVEGTVPVGRRPHIVRVLPGGQTVLATSEGDQQLTIFDAESLEVVKTVPVFATPRVPAAASDGSKIYQTIRWLNGMLVIDTESGRITGRIALSHERFAPEGKDAHGVGVRPRSGEVWLTSQTGNNVTIVEAESGQQVATIVVGRDPNWIEFTSDGSLAVVSNTGDGTATIIDVEARRVRTTISVGPSPKRLTIATVTTRP